MNWSLLRDELLDHLGVISVRTVPSRGWRKPVKGGGVLHQDSRARRRVWRPFCQQVEEDRIVRLFLLCRMRPVARPHHPFGGGFDVSAGNRHRVGVTGRADLAVLISPDSFTQVLPLSMSLLIVLKPGLSSALGCASRPR